MSLVMHGCSQAFCQATLAVGAAQHEGANVRGQGSTRNIGP
jgi:hypothetical protein